MLRTATSTALGAVGGTLCRLLLVGLLLLGFTALTSETAEATHGRFIQIEWVSLGGGEVAFTVRTAWRRGFFGNPSTGDPSPSWGNFLFGDGTLVSAGAANGVITDHSVAGDWIFVENNFTKTYADPTGQFLAGFSVCCRISSGVGRLANRWDLPHTASALVNPSVNSPVISSPPIVGVPEGPASTFQVFATDPDGATLRYRLSTNFEATGSNLTGLRHDSPPGMSIDPVTGIVTWDNVGLAADRFWTAQIIVEKLDADNDVISHVPFDLLLQIGDVDNDPPQIVTNPASPITVNLGDTVTFDVTATDPDDGDTIELTSVALPPGATMNPVLPISGPWTGITSTFTWTPGALGTFFATFTAQDQLGAVAQTTVTINVVDQPPVDTTPPICGPITLEFDGPGGALSAINSSAEDPESGIAEVRMHSIANLNVFIEGVGPYTQGDVHMTPDPNPTSVAIRGERISFAQGGRLVVRVFNGVGLFSNCDPVVAQLSSTAPDDFALEPAYPNPVNIAHQPVRIGFSVAEPGPVSMRVFDLTGREVMRLVDQVMEPGRYEVTWEGTDGNGRQLASGVYIYRIEAGAFSQTLRMTIIH